MPAVEGLQQAETSTLSSERPGASLFSGRRAQRTVAYVTIVYVPLQLLSLAWASSAVSNAEELGSDVRRTALPRRDKGQGA